MEGQAAPALQGVDRVPLKIYFRVDGEDGPSVVKRVSLAGTATLSDVSEMVGARSCVAGGSVDSIRYVDPEGDAIDMTTEAEWEECVRLWWACRGGVSLPPLCLHVVLPADAAVDSQQEVVAAAAQEEPAANPEAPRRRRRPGKRCAAQQGARRQRAAKKGGKKSRALCMRFSNNTPTAKRLFWYPKGNPDGRVLYAVLGPGIDLSVRTYPGHVWMLEDIDSGCAEVVTVPAAACCDAREVRVDMSSNDSGADQPSPLADNAPSSTSSSSASSPGSFWMPNE